MVQYAQSSTIKTGNTAPDGGFVYHVVTSTEIEIDGEMLEKTTYITQDSDEDGNNICLLGFRLSLMLSGSEQEYINGYTKLTLLTDAQR